MATISKTKTILSAIALNLLFLSTPFYAFDTSITKDTLILPNEQQTNMRVTNKETSPVALEISIKKRKYKETGEETYEESTDQLLAIPSQVILNPGEEQVIAIRWIGPGTIETEQPFRIIVENVPIDLSEKDKKAQSERSAEINIIYRIVKGFYIQPPDAKAKLEVDSIKYAQTKEKKKALKFWITNKGTAHKIIRSLKASVTFANQSNTNQTITYPLEMKKESLDGGINFLATETRILESEIPTDWIIPSNYIPLTLKIDDASEL